MGTRPGPGIPLKIPQLSAGDSGAALLPGRLVAAASRRAIRSIDSIARRSTAALRLRPDFVIIGAQRSGTTSLYNYLAQHPCVAPARRKEIHYFDLSFDRGERWYTSHFPTKLARWLHRSLRDPFYLTGEASPYYLYDPDVPSRFARQLPRAKLIALLRNPADRAISHYFHERHKGREKLPLARAIEQEPARLAFDARTPSAQAFARHAWAHRRYSYLARGRYAEQLERWQRLFQPERLLVLASEDLFHAPRTVYRRVLQFLRLPSWEPASYPQLNARPYTEDITGVRGELLRYFRPHNERLYELIGRDLGWERQV